MRLRILGSLEIVDDQGTRIHISGAKRRALLATLVVRAGRTVSMSKLIEELWAANPPANAVNALQAHIGRLRKTIATTCAEDRLATQPPGYTLQLNEGETDASEFTRLITASRTAPDPTPLLRAALSLWRGPALDGCVTGDICAGEASALEELRMTAMEALYDGCLANGRHAEVIADLTEATALFPLRERFYDQLMQALSRAGRQSDALAVYGRARTRFITELGVEPGPALRARAQAVHTDTPAPPDNDLTREVAELQHKIDALVTRQARLLARLAAQHTNR
ncbi:BTAD domain-containing putative transcriptional regulator [Actinophytocola sp. NPDC049390]|uniref:AfsR/SARP family transcriptional regulator n=1 Tax=Actinophytocola sp. NPDC049390 TaxID=3363894 RepID=UPI0037A9284C